VIIETSESAFRMLTEADLVRVQTTLSLQIDNTEKRLLAAIAKANAPSKASV
jgi:hypothetical protein